MNYGSCRSCAEVDAQGTNKDCANNDDGPALGLFTTIGFSDFEPNANATSNVECAALCAADEDCIAYEIRIPEEGKLALCEHWRPGADGTNVVYPHKPDQTSDSNFRCYIRVASPSAPPSPPSPPSLPPSPLSPPSPPLPPPSSPSPSPSPPSPSPSP